MSFFSKYERKKHTLAHFEKRVCVDCDKLILRIDDEWYESHQHSHRLSTDMVNFESIEIKAEFEEKFEDYFLYPTETPELIKCDFNEREYYDDQMKIIENPYDTFNESFIHDEVRILPGELKESDKNSPIQASHTEIKPTKRKYEKLMLAHELRLRTGPSKCDICSKTTKSFQSMRKHMKRYHSENKIIKKPTIGRGGQELRPTGRLQCDICRKWAKNIECMRKHMISQHCNGNAVKLGANGRFFTVRRKMYVCYICRTQFKNFENLRIHMRQHTGIEPFECSECERKFKSKSNLATHKTIHSTEKKYRCGICEKVFRCKSNMRSHLMVHSGEKRNRCDIESCGQSYTYLVDLKRHKFRAHGIYFKKFPCPICPEILSERKLLRSHMLKHDKMKIK